MNLNEEQIKRGEELARSVGEDAPKYFLDLLHKLHEKAVLELAQAIYPLQKKVDEGRERVDRVVGAKGSTAQELADAAENLLIESLEGFSSVGRVLDEIWEDVAVSQMAFEIWYAKQNDPILKSGVKASFGDQLTSFSGKLEKVEESLKRAVNRDYK